MASYLDRFSLSREGRGRGQWERERVYRPAAPVQHLSQQRPCQAARSLPLPPPPPVQSHTRSPGATAPVFADAQAARVPLLMQKCDHGVVLFQACVAIHEHMAVPPETRKRVHINEGPG